MGKTGHLVSRVFSDYKARARDRGIPFSLTRSEFFALTQLDCYICGAEPCNRRVSALGAVFRYNGIDRVDSKLGYTAANVMPCCWKCNNVKAAMDLPELKVHLRKMVRGLRSV